MQAVLRSSGESEMTSVICESSTSNCLLQSAADCSVESCRSNLTVLVFPFFALFIGVLGKPLSRIIKLPYTLMLLLIGVVLGLLGCGVNLGLLSTSLRQWVHLNPPEIFFYVFLAPLIFEAAFNTQLHVFKRVLIPVLTAATVIVVVQVFLIAAFQKFVVQTDDWTWWAALMFGAMLSATDPISVTATLKSVGASEALNTLIEGESLLNDGTAFVLWEAFFENTLDENALTVAEIVVSIFRLSLGGALMGVAFGLVALIVLSLVYDEFEVETSLTVVVAFLGFWTAQAPSRLSGVICNVASGLLISSLGRPLISPSVRDPLAEFWELLSWIANTIVFTHAGVLVSSFVWSCSGDPHGVADYLWIFGYFAFLQLIRVGLMFLFYPVLRIGNDWFTWKEGLVVGASGLRGAVSLILALEVGSSAVVPLNVRTRVVLWTTGIVLLSLVINGLFIKPLLHWLKLDKADKTREDFLRRARSLVIQRTLMILDLMAIEGSLKQARWSYVAENVLPKAWLEEAEHASGYEDAVENFSNIRSRASLDIVADEGWKHKVVAEMGRRISVGEGEWDPSLNFDNKPGSPGPMGLTRSVSGSPRLSIPRTQGTSSRRESTQSPLFQYRPSIAYSPKRSAGDAPLSDDGIEDKLNLGPSALSPDGETSVFYSNPFRPSYDPAGTYRDSLDHDVQRYQNKTTGRMTTELEIHREIASLHANLAAGQPLPESTEKDREVRRRMLTSMLHKVRSLSNATLAEFTVLVHLDDDIQEALDANETHKDYDMYDFLDRRGLNQSKWWHRVFRWISEGRRLRGETTIATAHVVLIVLTHVLKEDFMHDSALVFFEAESLFEGAATLLNRMEELNPFAISWVESQFAVHFTHGKQDTVLEDLLSHGSLDEHEHAVLKKELIETRRRHFLVTSRKTSLPAKSGPRELLKNHSLFQGMAAEKRTRVVQSTGRLHHLRSGQELDAAPGDLVVVLDGALRPVNATHIDPQHVIKDGAVDTEHGFVDVCCDGDASCHPSGNVGSKSHDGRTLQFKSGGTMHWCYPKFNAVCGPGLALVVGNSTSGPMCATDTKNLRSTRHNRLRSCEVTGDATVWTLPIKDAKRLSRSDEIFRTEITRSLARQMALESISDLPPYALSHVQEALTGVQDEFTVLGRATKLLERLPYMEIIALRSSEENVRVPVHGPGVLLNGTVRVSIVDTSGLVGAVNLLHERLTGPALLPTGALVLEETFDDDGIRSGMHTPDDLKMAPSQSGEARFAAFAAEALALAEASEFPAVSSDQPGAGNVPNLGTGNDERQSPAYAHVLIEEMSGDDHLTNLALKRLRRWTGSPAQVDQAGRLAIIRHVSLNKTLGEKNVKSVDLDDARNPASPDEDKCPTVNDNDVVLPAS